MISARSALLDRRTRSAIFRDSRRAQVAIRLHGAGLSEPEIAQALNCSRRIVMRYMFAEVLRFGKAAAAASIKKNRPPDPRPIPRSALVLLRYRPPTTKRGIGRERERLARNLADEICVWVGAIEMSGVERQQVIDCARMLLDASPLKTDGERLFDENRVFAELVRIWRPKKLGAAEDSATVIGRWLASWIRFWIAQPIVWDRALDLVFEHFGVGLRQHERDRAPPSLGHADDESVRSRDKSPEQGLNTNRNSTMQSTTPKGQKAPLSES